MAPCDSARRAMHTDALGLPKIDRGGRAPLPPTHAHHPGRLHQVKGPPWKNPHRAADAVGLAGRGTRTQWPAVRALFGASAHDGRHVPRRACSRRGDPWSGDQRRETLSCPLVIRVSQDRCKSARRAFPRYRRGSSSSTCSVTSTLAAAAPSATMWSCAARYCSAHWQHATWHGGHWVKCGPATKCSSFGDGVSMASAL